MSVRFSLAAWRGLALLCALLSATSFAQAMPTIRTVSLRGLQSGGTVTLAIDGADLLPTPQVLLGAPIARQTVKPGGKPNRVEVEISLDAAVSPGIYNLRLATPRGISNPIAVGVDALRQAPLSEAAGELPVALTGTLAGGQIVRTKFEGHKGQAIVVDVEARRIGSPLDPVVRLYDARHAQLAFAPSSALIGGDCRLSAKLPADGTYSVELHHALYRAEGNSFLRLKIGDLQFADVVLPLAVGRELPSSLKLLFDNLPAGSKAELDAARLGAQPVKIAAARLLTGSPPGVLRTDVEELFAPQSADHPPEVAAPCGLNGQIAQAGKEDRYRLLVKPGMKLRFDVLANRVGSPLDGVLAIRGEKGNQLATNDDRPGTRDPGLDFTVPANVKVLEVALKDQLGRGGPEYFYRIGVTNLNDPDFTLQIDDDRLAVAADGATTLRVEATRQNYPGPIALHFDGLPSGVTADGAQIPAGINVALVTLRGQNQPPMAGLAMLVGQGSEAAAGRVRVAQLPTNPANMTHPWLRSELGVALTQAAPIGVAWEGELSRQTLPIGAKMKLPIKLSRPTEGKGPVRLTLIHNQPTPAKREVKQPAKPRPNAKPPKVVNEADRLLHLEGEAIIAADKDAGVATVVVPSELTPAPFDLVVRAELLTADQKTVLATAETPILHLQAVGGFKLELATATEVKSASGIGPVGKFKGKIVRQEGFSSPVRVMLTGLPKGANAEVLLPEDKSEFEIPVKLPFGLKVNSRIEAELVAVSVPDPDEPGGPIKSNEVSVGIDILAGEAPKGEMPLAIFEDEQKFVEALQEGGGQATLETSDKFSGSASVRVTPDQRFAKSLPWLTVNVREKPEPGEYRYLMFAWKKVGGEHICLQINHDGQWGATDGKPASFRYSAGAGECFGGSLQVAKELPSGWTVVTRDLFADFGEFTFNGIALSPQDGEFGLYDHIYLARSQGEFQSLDEPAKPARPNKKKK